VRAIIYAAVSTTAQAENDKESIPAQLADGRAAARRLGATVVAEAVIPGHSRNYTFLHQLLADCPEYAEFIAVVEADDADLVIARNWDRLVRTLDLSNDVDRVLQAHYVQCYLLNAPVMPLPPEEFRRRSRGQQHIERLPRFIQGWTAESESIERVARHAVGMRGRIARGLHGIAPNPPYGYRQGEPGGPLVVDPIEARWLRWMFQRRLDRVGYGSISAELNNLGALSRTGVRWQEQTVRRILQNPYYAGIVHWNDYTNEGIHEALIDRLLWQQVERINRSRTIHRARRILPLSSLCRCAHCDWRMPYANIQRRGHTLYYLRCSLYVHSHGQQCYSNNHQACAIEELVMARIRAYIADPQLYYARLEEHFDAEATQQRLTALSTELAALDARADRLAHGYLSGLIDDLQMHDLRTELVTARNVLITERGQLTRWQDTALTMTRQVGELRGLLDELDILPPERLNSLYGALIAKIILARGQPPRILGHLGEEL
jgi:hypothetical protein